MGLVEKRGYAEQKLGRVRGTGFWRFSWRRIEEVFLGRGLLAESHAVQPQASAKSPLHALLALVILPVALACPSRIRSTQLSATAARFRAICQNAQAALVCSAGCRPDCRNKKGAFRLKPLVRFCPVRCLGWCCWAKHRWLLCPRHLRLCRPPSCVCPPTIVPPYHHRSRPSEHLRAPIWAGVRRTSSRGPAGNEGVFFWTCFRGPIAWFSPRAWI